MKFGTRGVGPGSGVEIVRHLEGNQTTLEFLCLFFSQSIPLFAKCDPRYLSKDHEICFFIGLRKSFGFLATLLHLRSACKRRLTLLAQFQN